MKKPAQRKKKPAHILLGVGGGGAARLSLGMGVGQ